jgi:glycosyltransferase involved in cell wall biosynthesis
MRLIRLPLQVIYSGSDFFPDVCPAWLYKKLRPRTRWIQCVFHIYPPWRERNGSKLVNWLGSAAQNLSLWLVRDADGVVVINSEVLNVLTNRGFDPRKLKIIPPGIDYIKIQRASPRTYKGLTFDAVFMGRLKESKGVFDLPKIWMHVTKHQPRARLAIIGGGSEKIKSQIAADIDANGLSGLVDILGFIPSNQIYGLFKSAKVFIFPSYEEGFGIVIAEALAANLPIVAWDLPVFEELFGSAIIKVAKGDVDSFAKSILVTLRNGRPEKQRNEAKEVALRYGWDGISERMGQWLTCSVKNCDSTRCI